jgi:hypothetical protein
VSSRGSTLRGVAISTLVLHGCVAPAATVDDDALCSRARPLPPALVVKDSIDPAGGDRVDCRRLSWTRDARATIEYRFGTPFEPHDVTGTVTVYDDEGAILDRRTVMPSVYETPFEVTVKGGRSYYVHIEARQGASSYTAQVKYESVDPCARCTADQECVGQRCEDVQPDCKGGCSAGEMCLEGGCVDACNPPCPRRWVCDAERHECERSRRRRQRPRNVARTRRATGPTATACPGCPNPTDTCGPQTGFRCVWPQSGVTTGPIRAQVVSTVRGRRGTVLYLNRGRRHGVSRGNQGRLCGAHPVVVTKTFATRSKARTNASLEELAGCNRVVIRR